MKSIYGNVNSSGLFMMNSSTWEAGEGNRCEAEVTMGYIVECKPALITDEILS